MRKLLSVVLAGALVASFTPGANVLAAPSNSISIYIDGNQLYTDQPPVTIGGRTLLPLRAIFEGLSASVEWNERTKVVTAKRDDTTVVLKLGSKTATVNGQTVALDVPAQSVKNRTMVPVRFVSEAMGEEVDWNPSSKAVNIKTSTGGVSAVPYVSARINGQNGDGRDIEVSFSKVSKESNVDHYRVMLVKSEKSNYFTTSTAQSVSSRNYTTVLGTGGDQYISLTSQTLDVDGDLIRANQSYVAYVLTVSKSNQYALSSGSQKVTVTASTPVSSVTNVKASDVSDYGDGRDLYVSFTKPDNEANIANYRVLVVKTKDAYKFDLTAANAVSSQNSTLVDKSGKNVSTTLSSNARDTSGEYIKDGVPYTVYVLAEGSNSKTANRLSTASTSITLGSTVGSPVITSVADVNNYNDGRDLQVSFNKSANESKISHYRIFVVRVRDGLNFTQSEANAVASGRYYDVAKTGYNIVTTLPSNAKEVNGSYIGNGEDYRVYVMAISSDKNAYNNALSSSSSTIRLSNNVGAGATNVSASDVSDYNDGRDMSVSFTRATDESNINHYRIMVVKSSDASRFSLSDANRVSSSYYTSVSKTGRNISTNLASNARDVDGALIRNGVNYQVFVLAVGNYGDNTLSNASSTIRLADNYNITAPTYVVGADVADYNDGRDLQVVFNRSNDESNIDHYRVMVVKSGSASNFTLSRASSISSSNYTYVSKTGGNYSLTLDRNARDVDGAAIRNGVSYRIFVLAVGRGSYTGSYALSPFSSEITLATNVTIDGASNVTGNVVNNQSGGSDIEVTFTKSSNETNVAEYRIMFVPVDLASSFNLSAANDVNASNYTRVTKQNSNIRQLISDQTRDVRGNQLIKGVPYRVYVLTTADSRIGAINVLSASSKDFTLVDQSVPAVGKVYSNVEADGQSVRVTYDRAANESNIAYYEVMLVPVNSNWNLSVANQVSPANYKIVNPGGNSATLTMADNDAFGNKLVYGVEYQAYVLSVANGKVVSINNLSTSSNGFKFVMPTNPNSTPIPDPVNPPQS
ncbi:copper amine oxidase N-terminal domain-containing protein [Paenibacillus guangzhouensis]|uniref:copper amine oxidase N-terminal domain-containing protein n=1 Tax=Paenibacillus guangzhouensis TaxID=1473112 RepID=UPI0012671527|nr:copper amine oxidase N-terminal domain-containing protein [Paenibacillus guangzhouensis]